MSVDGGRASPTVGYVVPHLAAGSTEHFAHAPALVEALGEVLSLVVIVERGEAPASLPGARAVLRVGGGSRLGRVLGTVRVVLAARRLGVDTFFLRYSRTFTLVLLALRPLLRHRIVYWRSGMADLVPAESAPPWRRLHRQMDHRLNRGILCAVDRVVTGPERMVTYTRERWRLPDGHVRLLYNDIDPHRFAPMSRAERGWTRQHRGVADDSFVALFVHQLSFRRGTRLLLPTLTALSGLPGAHVELLVVGGGPDRDLLDHQSARALPAASMRTLGPVPNSALAPLYGAADVFLMPSYEEGFPRVVLEAMAAGLPVVACDAGGTRDVLGADYPYVVPTGDVAGLVRCLQEVRALSPEQRKELGRGLRGRVLSRFSIASVVPMYEDVLR